MGKIGQFAADGSIETDVTECALTGRPVLGWNSVKQAIEGTPYFYRYLSSFAKQLTDEKRAEVAASIPTEYAVGVDMAAGKDITVIQEISSPPLTGKANNKPKSNDKEVESE